MRSFEYAEKEGNKAYVEAKLPEYSTKNSAGADFFCAEEVTIPSIYKQQEEGNVKPTLVHTGIKACMEEDEVLYLYNRSSNPAKLGLVLANGVGVIDSDYYSNPSNDGEIMFAFYNVNATDITLKVGDKLGQGVFSKFLRPTVGAEVSNNSRVGGFGSTDGLASK